LSDPYIADASIVGAWCFENEATPETDLLLDQLDDTYIVVPALFLFEIQNMLRKGERDGKISLAKSNDFWDLLQSFDVRVEPTLSLTSRPLLLEIGREYGLTPYDAAYFDLARRSQLPLATLDKDLIEVCRSKNIPLLP